MIMTSSSVGSACSGMLEVVEATRCGECGDRGRFQRVLCYDILDLGLRIVDVLCKILRYSATTMWHLHKNRLWSFTTHEDGDNDIGEDEQEDEDDEIPLARRR
jgi:hypothetical protein